MDLRSAAPFWLLRSGLVATYPPLDADERCDVAVIGAGITGALVAHTLIREGVDTVVIDRRDATLGSTVASTGLLLYETDVELHDLAQRVTEDHAVRSWKLGQEAVDHLGCLARQLCAGDYTPRDTLYFASRRAHLDRLHREYELRRKHGFDVDLVEGENLEGRGRGHAAILSRGNAEIDPYRFTHALLRAALAHGARVYDRTDVKRVECDGRAATLHTDRGPVVRSRAVVHATGYEAGSQLGYDVGEAFSTFAAVTEPLEGGAANGPMMWETDRPYTYVRGTPCGRLMVGGADLRHSETHSRPGIVAKRARRLERGLRRMRPDVPSELAFSWGGTFMATEDGLPRIDADPHRSNLYFALGYGGNGITFAMIAAKLLADRFLGRPNDDAKLFRLER